MVEIKKIDLLSSDAAFDHDEMIATLGTIAQLDTCGGKRNVINSPTFDASRRCRLFKTLYTNRCSFDCKYCINSSSVKRKRFTYSASELCRVFQSLHGAGMVDGIFLSSAMKNDPEDTMEELIEAAETLRRKFNGYIHLKILPGSSYDQVKRATDLADRISINLEAPAGRLEGLSDIKDHIQIMNNMKMLGRLAPGRHVTQFIVGATEETDLEIIETLEQCYGKLKLARAYFSRFQPQKDTPMENKKPASRRREHRLYNVDYLLRIYGIKAEEVKAILDDDGNLPREDPKVLIAKNHFDSPIDLNQASYEDMLKVPGIGPKTAMRILKRRRESKIKTRREFRRLGVILKKADPFIAGGQRTLASY